VTQAEPRSTSTRHSRAKLALSLPKGGNPLLLAFLFAVSLLLSHPASGQVATGFPPYGSFGGGPFDVVNNANRNVHFEIPIINKAGRGMPFNYAVGYDSSIWSPVSSSGAHTWTPVGQTGSSSSTWGWGGISQAMVGYATFYTTVQYCNDHNGRQYSYDVYSSWSYYDSQGTGHAFPGLTISNLSLTPCTNNQNPPYYSGSATTTDGSGWQISVSAGPIGMPPSPSATVYTVSGVAIVPPFFTGSSTPGSLTDPNGNVISYSSGGTFTDTLGTTALTIAAQSTTTTYTYTPPGTGTGTVTFKRTLQTVQTNFGCPGISEYGATQLYLVSEIDLPDQSSNPSDKYTISYEATPGNPTHVTGRIASITLPTGGTINYAYSGGYNGISCNDGSTATLKRTTPDGVWMYYPGSVIAPADPQGNQASTTMYFQGVYETERDIYKNLGATLVETVNTCYNSSSTSCNSTAVTLPITQRTVTTTLGTLKSQTQTFYNTYGLPTKVDEYDFGAGGVGNFKRETMICYASLNYIQDHPSAKLVYSTNTGNPSDCSGTANLVAKTAYGYDSIGNLLTETHTNTGGSPSLISRSFTYGAYGVLHTSSDFKGNPTSYTNTACSNSFPTTITLPITSLTYTLTWDCNGGVVTSVKDPNQQTTTYQYTDPNFWRLKETDYPDGGKTTIAYNDTPLPFSISTYRYLSSSVSHQTTQVMDGLGRVVHNQDNTLGTSVDTNYDSLGRVSTVSNPHTGTSQPTDGLTTYGYDALNRATSITYPDTAATSISYSYSTLGYCATTTDAAGKVRNLCSDALGRITSVTEDPNGLNYLTTYQYGDLDDLHIVNQGSSQTRTYNYDMLGRLTSAQTPEAGTTTYSYAASGTACSGIPSAPCSRTDNAVITTTYAYDAVNRLISKSYNDLPQTPTANYFYDQASVTIGSWSSPTLNYPKGRLTEATTTSSGSTKTAVVYSYDQMGRTKNFWQCNPSNCGLSSIWNTQYTYDWAGDVTSWVHPAGYTFTTPVNAAQQVTAVQSSLSDSTHPPYLAQNVTYTAWGAVRQLTNGCVGSGCTNVQETYDYNKRLQPVRIQLGRATNNSANYCLVYNYYGGSNPSSCAVPSQGSTDNGNAIGYWYQDNVTPYSHTATNAYDNVNRLTSAVASPFGTGTWGYNLSFSYTRDGSNGQFGNMACVTVGPPCGNGNLTFNGNNQINSAGYSYGLQGNMTADGVHTYAYDAEGNLINVDGGSTITETYNALGWRVEANASGTVVDYQHDAAGQMIGGAWPGGSNQFMYFRGGLLAQYWSGDGARFAHINGLGSTQQFTDWTGGNPMDTLFYPWGQPGPTNSSVEALWAGFDDGNGWLLHEWQTDTRRYTQSASRWFTPDPLGGDVTNPQSLNRYAYVLNNPTTLSDPTGLCGETWFGVTVYDSQGNVTQAGTTSYGQPCENPEEQSQSNQPPNVDWGWGASPEDFGGGGGCGLTPGQQKIAHVVNSALQQTKLSECLNKLFGPGNILNNKNLPILDTTQSEATISVDTKAAAYATFATPVPATGRGTVLMASEYFNSIGSVLGLQATFLHETANILAIQRNQSPHPSKPQGAGRDTDAGAALEECMFGGLVY
jgi:RHS repeat-associated protein